MADISFVTSTNFTGVGTTALTVALGSAWVAGGTGIIVISLRSAAGTATVTSVTGGGGTWSKVKAATNSTPTVDTEIWATAVGGSTLGTGVTLTVTISGTTTETSACTGLYLNVGSIVSSSETSNTGTSDAPSVTLTTATVRSWLIAGTGTAYAVAQSASTGTLRSTANTGSTSSGVSVALADINNTGPVGTSLTVTTASSTDSAAWVAIGIELQPSSPTLRYTTQVKGVMSFAGRLTNVYMRPSLSLRGTTAVQPIEMPFPQSVMVTPSSVSLIAGATQQLVAQLLYSNNFTLLITNSANTSYTTTNAGVATVNSSGLITAVAVGSATIEVTWEAVGVGTFMGTCAVTVTPAQLVSITVTPSNDVVLPSATVNYTATGHYTDSSTANITSSVAWTSSNTSAATINASTGVATAASNPSSTAAPTTTNITASLDSITGTTALIVEASLLGIVVSPESFSLAKGLTQQLSCQGTYSNGTVVDLTSSVTWASGTPADATVSSSGLVTSVSPGSSSVSATLGLFSDSITVTTTAATLESIAVTPANAIILPLGTEQYTATGTYSDSSTSNITSSVAWASSNTSIATINSSGLATATNTTGGATNISATLGIVGATALFVTESSVSPTLSSLVATPNSIVLTFSADVENLATNPLAWTVGILGSPTDIAPVTVTAITVAGAVVTLTTTTQTGGASYVLNIPPAGIYSTGGYPWLGPFAQDFTGGSGLTNTFVVTVIDAQTLMVTFERPVMETGIHGALQTSNYSLTPNNLAILGVTAVTAAQYIVSTAPQTYGTVYTLTISNVWDLFFNPI